MKKKLFFIILLVAVFLVVAGPVFLLFYLSPLNTLLAFSSTKNVQGSVIDCETKAPIADADVSINGIGWGWDNNQLIWDKSYTLTSESNENGVFNINYKIGNSLVTKKEGYLPAQNYISANTTIIVGLRKNINVADKSEWTYDCRLASECEKTRMECK